VTRPKAYDCFLQIAEMIMRALGAGGLLHGYVAEFG
jgi:hypothetical protein